MKMFYLVFGLIPIFLMSPLRAEEESDKPAEESGAISEEEVITSEVLEQSVAVDTTDPIVRLRMDAEREIAVILEQIEELENVDGVPELQKEIERIKTKTEIEILKLRIEDAEEEGNEELLKELEIALDNLLHPEKYWPKTEKQVREDDTTVQVKGQKLRSDLPLIDEPRELEKELSQKTKRVAPEIENEKEEEEKSEK